MLWTFATDRSVSQAVLEGLHQSQTDAQQLTAHSHSPSHSPSCGLRSPSNWNLPPRVGRPQAAQLASRCSGSGWECRYATQPGSEAGRGIAVSSSTEPDPDVFVTGSFTGWLVVDSEDTEQTGPFPPLQCWGSADGFLLKVTLVFRWECSESRVRLQAPRSARRCRSGGGSERRLSRAPPCPQGSFLAVCRLPRVRCL